MYSIAGSPPAASNIASNLYSLAESKFEPSFVPLGIYLETRMIGFFMYGKDPENGTYI
jgi:diamine N-acetyltransferase